MCRWRLSQEDKCAWKSCIEDLQRQTDMLGMPGAEFHPGHDQTLYFKMSTQCHVSARLKYQACKHAEFRPGPDLTLCDEFSTQCMC